MGISHLPPVHQPAALKVRILSPQVGGGEAVTWLVRAGVPGPHLSPELTLPQQKSCLS